MADPVVTSHHAIAPPAPTAGATVTFTLDGRPATAPRRRVPDRRGRAGRDLHPALLLPPAHEAGRHVPDVPGRGDRAARRHACSPPATCPWPRAWRSITDLGRRCKKAQDGVLEFLLVNHPLDCPVCDKGGECPLQDQTLAYGPGESRFVEEKRHWAKPIPISELVLLDRERCIQCGRCVRFADEIAGEAQIDFLGRGDAIEVNIFDGPRLLVVLQRQHRADLPGGRAHGDARTGSRPGPGTSTRSSRRAPPVRLRLPGRGPVLVEPRHPPARHRQRPGEPELAVRQGPLRLRGGQLRGPRRPSRSCAATGGELEPASWAEALAVVAERLARCARPSRAPRPSA